MNSGCRRADRSLPSSGLHYFQNFVNAEEEAQTVKLIDSRAFSQAIHRRQQFWGELYYHTTHDVTAVQPRDQHIRPGQHFDLQPMQWLVDRFVTDSPYCICPVFKTSGSMLNQCLVNEYIANQGVSSHIEDGNSFGAVIMTVSLFSPIYMTFKRPAIPTNECPDILQKHEILLRPRSVLIVSGEARYKWRHGITKKKTLMLPDGCTIRRGADYRRLSLQSDGCWMAAAAQNKILLDGCSRRSQCITD